MSFTDRTAGMKARDVYDSLGTGAASPSDQEVFATLRNLYNDGNLAALSSMGDGRLEPRRNASALDALTTILKGTPVEQSTDDADDYARMKQKQVLRMRYGEGSERDWNREHGSMRERLDGLWKIAGLG